MKDERPKIVMFNPKASEKLTYDGPPLSILMAVSMIDRARYNVKIVDWHYPDYEERLRRECADALVYGVTCMTGFQIGAMLASLKIVREANPAIPVVVGGWHPTLLPEQTLQHPLVDYIVMGQGPRTFQKLVDCISAGEEPQHLPGVGYKKNGELVINPRPPVESINSFPYPPNDLLDQYEDFLVQTSFGKRVAYLLTSQGCPFNCSFCSEAAFHNRNWSARPVDGLMEHIIDLKKKYAIDGVAVSDSNFFVDERRVADFCRQLKPLQLRWGSTASRSEQLARFSDETWLLMKESGLYDIFLGVEAADNDTLRTMHKQNTIEDTLAVLPRAAKYGIKIQSAFVIGVPGSDIERDFQTDMEFINKIRQTGQVTQFHMFTFAPFPGIPFLDECIRLGYQQPKRLEDWGNYNLHMDVSPWIPKKYPRITDQLSVYFMFLTGNVHRVVEAVVPRGMRWAALAVERLVYHLSDFRVKHLFFRFPIEHRFVKFVLRNREKLFGDKKLMF